MALRPLTFSIPSTTELEVTFSEDLSRKLSSENFAVESLSGAMPDLEVTGVTINGTVATVRTRPQVTGNFYLLRFLDTPEVIFTSERGNRLVDDAVSRELFFVGIDTVNPIRDRMFRLVPKFFQQLENTNLKNILSAQAEEFISSQRSIGEALSNNYLCADVKDEIRTRTAGATDRFANENAFLLKRISLEQTGAAPRADILDYTSGNSLERLQDLPVYPVSLQQIIVDSEEISIDTEGNSFDGFLINVRNRNIIKLLSLTIIRDGEEEDCNGNIGTEYDIERFKYSIQNNFYDQDFAFTFKNLEDNQILLSQFGNIERPGILDKIIISYLYKDLGRGVLDDTVLVSRVESAVNESVPTNVTRFFLDKAPIVNFNNKIVSRNGVKFRLNENSEEIPSEFRNELTFNTSKLPSKPGEYSVNYETGEVFLVGAKEVGEGTGSNNYVATYYYRREFERDLDYSISHDLNLVATPDRDLANQEAEIFINYDKTFAEGIDFEFSSHIEVMAEEVENRLNQSFSILTKNAPITEVFRIVNQTTGEVYTPIRHSTSEIFFAGNRSPEVKTIESENSRFLRTSNEFLEVIGEFIIPAFKVRITSNISNNSIIFEPGIPAELIDLNSSDYFIREAALGDDGVEVEDTQIRFFSSPGAGDLVTSLGISPTATPPSVGALVNIGTKGFLINLENIGILNKNLDAIGSVMNTSLEFENKDIFEVEKFFKPLPVNPGLSRTTSGGISVTLTSEPDEVFVENLSRLRKVGDYTVDYRNGIAYLAVSLEQTLDVGNAAYSYNRHNARNRNILTASGISKKLSAADSQSEALKVYERIFNDNNTIEILDLEDTFVSFDDNTLASTPDGNRVLVSEVREDYTVVVPNNILTINSILQLTDLVGQDLGSSDESERQAEYPPNQLVKPVKDGGRNLFDIRTVTFEDNVIDLKTIVRRRVFEDTSGDLSVKVLDSNAETFVSAKLVSTDQVIFDEKLNMVKVDNLSIVSVTPGFGTATVSIDATASLITVDTDGDFLLDSEGNRFEITAVDTFFSTLTVEIPAENNVTATSPALGTAQVVVKPTVIIDAAGMTISIPSDSGLTSGDMLEITYLTTLIPDIGTPLVVDYRFGFIYFDYTYLADQLLVWYEYGDNAIDWSINNSIVEGETYYVSYQYGALRDALRTNFGTLTNIPFFENFSLSIDRELYRNALKGTLQAFPKGPTIPAYTELIKAFTEINPNIDELVFGNWILGRDYLCPGKINYEGVLTYADGKFADGLKFNDDVSVDIPSISGIDLGEGTLDVWIRPDWGGINNDASLTFDIDNIGPEKIFLEQTDNPFDSENDWSLIPASNSVGGTDHIGSGVSIFNYRTDTEEDNGFKQGVFGIFKEISLLNRITNIVFSSRMKIDTYGLTYNSLVSASDEELDEEICEDEQDAFFIVGCDGPGTPVEGPFPAEYSTPPSQYNLASFLIPDGTKSPGIHLSLLEVYDCSNFKTVIEDFESEELPKYDRPHRTRNCVCSINNTIDILERFNELIIDVDINDTISLELFKEETNIIDNHPSIFNMVDEAGVVYPVVGFQTDTGIILDRIPDTFNKILIKKFGVNNRQLSQLGSEAINESLPSGLLRFMFKAAIITSDPVIFNSSEEFDFEKVHAIDWTEYHEYTIDRIVTENIVTFNIDEHTVSMFYTDSLESCPFDMELSRLISDVKGVMIGALDKSILSTIKIDYARGTFFNRYNLEDIYIGVDGYNPRKIPFTINRDNFPKVAVGLPPNADTGEGIFIGYDELCKSQISGEVGQWIFRTRADRSVEIPVEVTLEDGIFVTVYENLEIDHNFSGVITTDGEFSSVLRASRDEDNMNCAPGEICNSTFRFCGNELLEEFGWAKLDDSESDLINVLTGGRETQRGKWRKHGEFSTSAAGGIYRMGPSSNSSSCVDEINFLGNLLYTENPCPGGDQEYLVSLRVSQSDASIAGSDVGAFSGGISGNLTGITPIHFNDGEINFKLSLAYSLTGEPLILLIDAEQNNVLDILHYTWNDLNFHEYRIVKEDDNSSLFVFVDDLLVSQLSVDNFATPAFNSSSDFIRPNLAHYVFDNKLVSLEDFHNNYLPNIIDIDLAFFSGIHEVGIGELESSDILINTDAKIRFSFNIDSLDAPDGYDAYDSYADGYLADELFGVDELFITSDKLRYIVDTGIGEANERLSIFKDGKGFLNFRIFSDSLRRGGEVGMYNLATNIKHFKPGEIHHVAASWKFNSLEERDEMHLFIDGLEAPNIYKFGGKIPVMLNDKFSDVSKEVLYNFLVDDIEFCDEYTDGTTTAGSSIFLSKTANFEQSMIGRSIIVTDSILAPTFIGEEFIVKSVIDSQQVILGRGDNLDTIEFSVSTSDISFKFPPTAGIKAEILTDLKNSRFAVFRTKYDGTAEEFGGILYTVEDGVVDIISGENVIRPKYRANIKSRIIEFVGEDNNCDFVATIEPSDIDVHIKTFGLNIERCKEVIQLASSTYSSVLGVSSIESHGAEPVSLSDVIITRIILDKTAIMVESPVILPNGSYLSEFSLDLDPETCYHAPTSKEAQIAKQNRGRLLSLFFDSDNVDFCEFDGYEDGYQDGSLDGELNTVTIYGTTTDGVNEETFFIDRNGLIPGTKYFTSVESVSGSLSVIDPDYFELGVISIIESNPITVSDNDGEKAEIFDYQNGDFILTVSGSSGVMPFELHPGFYEVEYPTFLKVSIPEVGHRMFIGSDFNRNNQFGGVIDQFRIISEMSTDTRPTERHTSGTRSVTNDFNKTIPACQDNQTLALIHFDNPIDLQSRRLRNKKFLDTNTNFTYTLPLEEREGLLEVVNNAPEFISKMINMGFAEEESLQTYYETHLAEGGPIFNEADYYRNVVEFVPSTTSVNEKFGYSGSFQKGPGLLLRNDSGIFRRDGGTIEFWVSPVIDTKVDRQNRYYVDIFAVKRVRIKSTSSTVIELPTTASEIHEVRLMEQTKEFSEFFSEDEIDQILFDEIYRSDITGKLTGGTGTDKNFSAGSKLSADGRKVFLAEPLPGESTDVIVTYIPLDSSGDRISIFKNEYSQIVFAITANGIDNVVSADIDWKKNTWHRVMCVYRTNSSFDTMKIFVDGQEGGRIRYGTGIIYTTGFVYGQFVQGDGQLANQDFTIPLSDDFRLISIGSDIFGDNVARGRLDNMRFSRIIRKVLRDPNGAFIDSNYSSNLNTVAPVVEDDATTLLLNFDEDGEKIDRFATVIDPKNGIFDFDIEVIDNFDKVIGINQGEIEDLIVELVNRLKPAHTNALVKFTKSRC